MPFLDKTGPMGRGPRTGRGLGKCKPSKKSKKRVVDDAVMECITELFSIVEEIIGRR